MPVFYTLENKDKYKTKEEILKRALAIKNIPLCKIDKTGRLSTGKGAIGTVIEESWFGYRPNSQSEPDFPEAGIELKVVPYIKSNNKIRSKERLVCNIIDYMNEYKKTFVTSSFWHKCNTMLIMAYEHLYDRPKGDYCIDNAIIFNFPKEDRLIIEQDWNVIMDKVRNGKANEISEGDTLYLAACTKGANSQSVRRQPFSQILAKQRAYSLKSSYMTTILNRDIFGSQQYCQIIKDTNHLRNETFESYIERQVSKFYGKTQEQLKQQFNIHSTSKNLNELLLAKMLHISGKIDKTEEFQKANITSKTIRVEKDGSIKESMSFPAFDFIELSKETNWEESKLYNYLSPKKFMFVIFQKNANDEYVFQKIMFWNIPFNDLKQVSLVWSKTKNVINEGIKFTRTNKGLENNLPKKSENPVAHVRPHGRDSSDVSMLPDGRYMTKQCFWLNNTYIAQQIKTKLNSH